MKKFPWDCEDCPMLWTYDLSIDDLTHVCLWSKNQIDDCDRYQYAECPLEKHDKEIQAAERKEAIQKFAEWFKESNYYLCYSDTIDDVLAEYEKQNEGDQT